MGATARPWAIISRGGGIGLPARGVGAGGQIHSATDMAEIEISAMTFGPFGRGHREGKAVMVAHSVAGDRLEVATISERRDYSDAKIQEIIHPSADRRSAPCPYLPR